jgi:DNA-binding response OmpR family regulator
VYGIVKQSGGYIWVSSKPGEGTAFTIQFPEVAEEHVKPGDSATREAAATPVGRETILLVEDEAPVRRLVHQILCDAGYTVRQAGHGREAVEIAVSSTQPIRLLITDVVMPHMNGRELADELGRRFPTMKVLFISGYPGNAVEERGILEPGSHFLQKPFNSETLLRRVRELLQANRAAQA